MVLGVYCYKLYRTIIRNTPSKKKNIVLVIIANYLAPELYEAGRVWGRRFKTLNPKP